MKRAYPLFRIVFWLLTAAPFTGLRAQQFEFSKELRFAQYLQDKEAVPEAIRVLEQVDTTALSRAQKDSLFYMLGWAAYSTRQLDRSIGSFLKVSADFSKYDKS